MNCKRHEGKGQRALAQLAVPSPIKTWLRVRLWVQKLVKGVCVCVCVYVGSPKFRSFY